MNRNRSSLMDWMDQKLDTLSTTEKIGRVAEVRGLIIESEGPEASVGDVCVIESTISGHRVHAEVVGFKEHRLLLMPYWQTQHIHPGCRTIRKSGQSNIPVSEALIGRIINGEGEPLDGLGPIRCTGSTLFHRDPPNPMERSPIRKSFHTGIKAIDSFTSMGVGQRMGIFAGSGVGKSTLLGMIAKGSEADINVIALVGERGRELREFIETDLGKEGLKKSIVVVSTSDQAAPLRLRAATYATAISEYFRDQGQNVLLLMDSLTRFAMAQREIGLSVGEPPTARGYTPSVFSIMPKLLERSGMSKDGSITALYTVLVEGDDLNEPVADMVRGIVDGHIVLSRKLAHANHYPAIDVLQSVSRLIQVICDEKKQNLVSQARDILSLYHDNEDMINIGAYTKGSNPRLDRSIAKREVLTKFLKQQYNEQSDQQNCWEELEKALK